MSAYRALTVNLPLRRDPSSAEFEGAQTWKERPRRDPRICAACGGMTRYVSVASSSRSASSAWIVLAATVAQASGQDAGG